MKPRVGRRRGLSQPGFSRMKICLFFATAANVFRIANGITNLATDVPCGIDFATIQSKFGHGTTSSSASKSSSSSSSVRNPRIINGVEADRFEFPWIVSFQYKKSGRHFCSGFVINRRYVLSALHCFQDGDMAVGHTLPLRILKARLGEHDLAHRHHHHHQKRKQERHQQEQKDQQQQENQADHQADKDNLVEYPPPVDFDIEKIIGHPNFQPHEHLHDIALIRLNRDIQWSAHIRPLCLPSNTSKLEHLKTNQLAIISGWGAVKVEADGGIGEMAKVLQKSRVRIVDREKCKDWLSQGGITWSGPQESHVCAGYEEGGTDVCWGDSGGPLQVVNEEGKEDDFGSQIFAVGIVSAGRSCALPKTPTVYTAVEFYLDWIKANIAEE